MEIEKQKIVDYLLNHEKSKGKAAFFLALGFVSTEWEVLAQALKAQAATGTISGAIHSPYGTRHTVDGPLETPDGRYPLPLIRTVWIEEPPSPRWRFVTAYPLERRNYD